MPASPRTDLDLGGFRRSLEELRERLNYEIGRLNEAVEGEHREFESSELSHYGQHPADEATETFLEERDVASQAGLQVQLNTVNGALERIEQGSYGYCTRCDKEIAAERLEALPETPFCIECAADLEQRI